MTGPDTMPFGREPDRLRDRFNAARYGHYFRTSTMFNSLTGTREWLYAVQDPQSRRCIVMKVRDHDSGQERLRVKGGLAFLDALNQMSRFEHPYANPNLLPLDEKEKNQLGDAHFQAFALNEGLIRDVQSGEFHPTLHGHVVTSGKYDPYELARVQKLAEGPQRTPASFVIPGHENILKSGETAIETITRFHQGMERLSTALRHHNNLLKLSRVYDQPREIDLTSRRGIDTAYMYHWKHRLNLDYENGEEELEEAIDAFNRNGIGTKMTRTYSALVNNGTESFPAFLHNRYMDALKALPPAHSDDLPAFQRILKLHELVFEHSRCRNAYQNTLSYSNDRKKLNARLENYQSSMKRLDKICRQLDFDPAQTGTVKAYVYSSEPFPYCSEIEQFINGLVSARSACQREIENEKRNLSALVPKNLSP